MLLRSSDRKHLGIFYICLLLYLCFATLWLFIKSFLICIFAMNKHVFEGEMEEKTVPASLKMCQIITFSFNSLFFSLITYLESFFYQVKHFRTYLCMVHTILTVAMMLAGVVGAVLDQVVPI